MCSYIGFPCYKSSCKVLPMRMVEMFPTMFSNCITQQPPLFKRESGGSEVYSTTRETAIQQSTSMLTFNSFGSIVYT